MNTTKQTVLITGGSAGIGLEIARLLSEKGNQVIITGRNAERLKKAASGLNNVTAIECDVTNESEVDRLVKRLHREFPTLSVLINNAGRAFAYRLSEASNSFQKASEEILTNYLSIVRLTEKLLPLLNKQAEAAIVNVSSIVAFVPGIYAPTYSASKAALHSYTQSLRLTLGETGNIQVFELMPPLVNTDFSQEIGGVNGISPTVVAGDLIHALENDQYEIHVGKTAQLYQLFRSSPAEALASLNSAR
jgi:uncharacterized oxidoreductase